MTYTIPKDITLYEIRTIDAWRDGDGWMWNDSYLVGHIELNPSMGDLRTRCIFNALRKHNYLSEQSKGRICLYDNGSSILEILDKNSKEPIIALLPLDDNDISYINEDTIIKR